MASCVQVLTSPLEHSAGPSSPAVVPAMVHQPPPAPIP
jgi:hypothetical protein